MPRIVHIDTLPLSITADIMLYATANPGKSFASIPEDRTLSLEQAIDRYLGWHGIHGYTSNIMAIIDEVIDPPDMHGIDLKEIEASIVDASDDYPVTINAKDLRTLINIIREM